MTREVTGVDLRPLTPDNGNTGGGGRGDEVFKSRGVDVFKTENLCQLFQIFVGTICLGSD